VILGRFLVLFCNLVDGLEYEFYDFPFSWE
jgi:hypothetical protein